MSSFYVGIDIGGTNTELGLFNSELELLDMRTLETIKPHWPQTVSMPAEFMDLLEREIRQLVMTQTAGGMKDVAAIGAGVPGQVDARNGMALGAANLGWKNVPFAAELSRRLQTRVFIDNDVRIYTFGEGMAGAGAGCRNLIGITLGTGLAAGVMVDGRLAGGSTWLAGEIGHDPVDGENHLCNCGRIGCLETIASATGIARLAEQGLLSHPDSLLHKTVSQRKLTSYDVFQACEAGDSLALAVFHKVGTILGRKLVSYLFLLNPEMVIVGGGAARAGHYLLDPIRSVIRELYNPFEPNVPQVAAAQLGNRAGLYGSVFYARNRLDAMLV